jgi:hypothetical protein
VLQRLRRIEAGFNKRYVVTRYHKVPDADRYVMAVAFEGETECGTRHAHILVRVPSGGKKQWLSQAILIGWLPFEFRFLWHKFSSAPALWALKRKQFPWESELEHEPLLSFGTANTARGIYTVKKVRETEVAWSKFEFVTPPKFKDFANENLKAISSRDRQARLALGLR